MNVNTLNDRSDELDEVLRAYFRSEMPHPWPAFAPPATLALVRPEPRKRSMWSSRAALAASILALLVGSLFLSGALRDRGPATPKTHDNDTAKPMKFGEPIPAPGK